MIGYGLATEATYLFMLGLLLLLPTIWFNICTIFKRSNALFPQQAIWITVGMITFQVLGEINELFSIVPLIMGLILLFKNSNIETHEG